MKRQTRIAEENRKKGNISRREFIKDAGLMGAAIGSTALLAGVSVDRASAQGSATTAAPATPVKLEVHDPTGAYEVTKLHPRRLDTLEGKTICEISVGGAWQFERTFPVIRELLQKKYPTTKIIPYTEFPVGAVWPDKKTLELIKEKGCQAAIIGNGG
jgi:hypothetical protein